MEQKVRRETGLTMGQTRTLVMTGVFAALGCAATMAVQIPTPTGGYVNLGDTVVILGGYLLGPVFGALAGGLGPAMADLLSGYAVYVPATLVIKAVMGVLAGCLYRLFAGRGMALCAAAAEAVMVAGYWLFDALLAAAAGGGSLGVCLAGSAAGIPGNLVQAAFGIAASTLLAAALRKSGPVRARFPNLQQRGA